MNKNISQASDNLPSPDLAVLPGNNSIQVKNVALVILTTLAVIFALDWAQNFVITLLLGILLSYTLNPVVKWLEYVKIPRMVGSSIVILTLILSIGFAGFTLRGQVQSIIAQLPEVTTKLTAAFETKRGDTCHVCGLRPTR